MPPNTENNGQVVTWTATLDRDADRFRLAVLHLAAGVPMTIGLAVLLLLISALRDGSVSETAGGAVLVIVVLALIGGPMSLIYLILVVKYGSKREIQKLTPSIGWFRLRYIPVSLLGGGILLLSVAIQPEALFIYLIGLAICKIAVDFRYTVGRIDPESASLHQVSGSAAAEYADGKKLDTSDRRVRTFDLSPLRCVYQQNIGDYTIFVLRYRSRKRWGRPLVLVVPEGAAIEVESAVNSIIQRND